MSAIGAEAVPRMPPGEAQGRSEQGRVLSVELRNQRQNAERHARRFRQWREARGVAVEPEEKRRFYDILPDERAALVHCGQTLAPDELPRICAPGEFGDLLGRCPQRIGAVETRPGKKGLTPHVSAPLARSPPPDDRGSE